MVKGVCRARIPAQCSSLWKSQNPIFVSKEDAPEKLVAPAEPEDVTEEEEVAEGHGKK